MCRNNSETNEEAERLEEIDILQDQIRQMEEELSTYRPMAEIQQEMQQLEQEIREREGQNHSSKKNTDRKTDK